MGIAGNQRGNHRHQANGPDHEDERGAPVLRLARTGTPQGHDAESSAGASTAVRRMKVLSIDFMRRTRSSVTVSEASVERTTRCVIITSSSVRWDSVVVVENSLPRRSEER